MPRARGTSADAATHRSAPGERVKHRSPSTDGKTKDAILDAAEALFSELGIASVSLREIARAAQVNPASITYHFGTKDELLVRVVQRRYEDLRPRRTQALDEVVARASGSPTTRQLLDVMFRPWLEATESGDPGWRRYSRILGSIVTTPGLAEVVESFAGQWERSLLELLRAAHPGASDEAIWRAITLSVGTSYFYFSAPPRLDAISGGRFRATDLRRGYAAFLDFVTAGFEASIVASGGT